VTTALFVVALVVAIACPAHMLWRMRRGEGAAAAEVPLSEPGELRRRRAEIEERIEDAARPERDLAAR